jgi:hypothetical protein
MNMMNEEKTRQYVKTGRTDMGFAKKIGYFPISCHSLTMKVLLARMAFLLYNINMKGVGF